MNQNEKINVNTFAIAALMILPISGIALAETPATTEVEHESAENKESAPSSDFLVNITNWKCEDCPFEEGFSSELELGLGNVSSSSYKFGEYNGLYEKGGVFIANAKVRYRDLDAYYLDLSASDLGLDTRELDIEGGKQGSYKVFFNYDEIFHAISDSISTPYRGNGSENLELPSSWVTSGTTDTMTQLANSLQSTKVDTQRKRMDVGFSFIPQSPWKYDFKFRHETRDGTKRSAGSILFNSAQLIEPVEYVTDEIDVSASYTTRKWQATLAYYGSFFNNENSSLNWQNAYTPMFAGSDSGQRALPPDNLFHQLTLSGGYQLSSRTRINGDISIGRMQQDEGFLPYTTNSSLSVSALPANSLDARVNTLTANIKLISSLTDKLRLNASYNYSDHDNKTPQAQYAWVSTDAYVNSPRTNQPYSFTRQQTKLAADYHISRATKLSAGLDYDIIERTLQEVDKTNEITGWGKLTVRGKDFMDMTFKLEHAERDASDYQVVPEIDPPQNPLLRKYNMTDRNRDTVGAILNTMVSETLSVGMSFDYATDNYPGSSIGLIDGKEVSVNVDASAILTESSSMHVFAGQETIRSSQSNSSTLSTSIWTANNKDKVNTIGAGYKHRLLDDMLDLGIDVVISQSTGRIDITSTTTEEFPELKVDLKSVKLYADYRLQENMSLHATCLYESYDTADWALDGVDPDSIKYVLAFGEQSPDYSVSYIGLSLRYKF